MSNSQALISAEHGRLNALVARREAVKERIREERKYPALAGEILRELKIENLRLKDEIEFERRRA